MKGYFSTDSMSYTESCQNMYKYKPLRWKVILNVNFEIKYRMSYNRGVPFPLKCKKKFRWRISGRHSYFCKNALDKISWTDWCCTCNFLLQNHLKSMTGSFRISKPLNGNARGTKWSEMVVKSLQWFRSLAAGLTYRLLHINFQLIHLVLHQLIPGITL